MESSGGGCTGDHSGSRTIVHYLVLTSVEFIWSWPSLVRIWIDKLTGTGVKLCCCMLCSSFINLEKIIFMPVLSICSFNLASVSKLGYKSAVYLANPRRALLKMKSLIMNLDEYQCIYIFVYKFFFCFLNNFSPDIHCIRSVGKKFPWMVE